MGYEFRVAGFTPSIRRSAGRAARIGADHYLERVGAVFLHDAVRGEDDRAERAHQAFAEGAWDGKVIDRLAPGPDEIVLPKSASSVFISTHTEFVLRNLGVRQLVI